MGSQENRDETSQTRERIECRIPQSGEEHQGDSATRASGNGSKIFFRLNDPTEAGARATIPLEQPAVRRAGQAWGCGILMCRFRGEATARGQRRGWPGAGPCGAATSMPRERIGPLLDKERHTARRAHLQVGSRGFSARTHSRTAAIGPRAGEQGGGVISAAGVVNPMLI
jgi:hypothetical protein